MKSSLVVFLFSVITISSAKRHFHGIKGYYAKYAPTPTPSPTVIYKHSRLCTATNDGGPPYRYHKPTRQCYIVGERGPCGEMMDFTLVDRDYGTCDCSQKLRCGRPLIYWPQQKRCFLINEQGPCTVGKWLTFGMYQTPVCKRNPCEPEMRKNPSRGSNFWFENGGQCFRTSTQGNCARNQILLNQWRDYKPKCYDAETQLDCPKTHVHRIDCIPGLKENHSQICVKKRLSQEGNRDERIPNIYHLKLE